MKRLFIGCIVCVLCSSIASAQLTTLPPQFVGVWSNSAKGCRLMKQGALDRMSTAEASRYGVIEVTTRGFQLLYSSGTGECEFTTPYEGEVVGGKVTLKAACVFKGLDREARVSLAIVAGGKLDLRVDGEGYERQVPLMNFTLLDSRCGRGADGGLTDANINFCAGGHAAGSYCPGSGSQAAVQVRG